MYQGGQLRVKLVNCVSSWSNCIWRMRKFPQSLARFSPFSRAKNTEISTPAINRLYYQQSLDLHIRIKSIYNLEFIYYKAMNIMFNRVLILNYLSYYRGCLNFFSFKSLSLALFLTFSFLAFKL